ncbi:MAG: DUF2779 domain-containing protein [Armatimonadetes bacterium]|nr:DUF2779 domain-containing protein [Armatimonadota bacterium]
METGRHVGQLARRLFTGVLIETPSSDWPAATSATAKAMADGADCLFEAAFSNERIACRPDILVREEEAWHLIEVKSGGAVNKSYLDDIAFQVAALLECGVRVMKASLIHIDKGYVGSAGQIDHERFFKTVDVTEDVFHRLPNLQGELHEVVELIAGPEPQVETNVHCLRPKCTFYDYCHEVAVEHDLVQLPRIKAERVVEFRRSGIASIDQIPQDEKLTPTQRKIADVVRFDAPFVSDDLGAVLRNLPYPLHFVDFEALSVAIPPYAGVRPFQILPFQWSLHIVSKPGAEPVHKSFLADGSHDPRKEFTTSLWNAVQSAATFVYYSNYEVSRLKELASHTVPNADLALEAFEKQGFDLLAVIKKHYYHPGFHGSFSIKSVLPAIVPDLSYDDLEIQGGDVAAYQFQRLIGDGLTAQSRASIREALEEYCERDTLAMVRLFDRLLEESAD